MKKLVQNPYIFFSPFLVFYITIALMFPTDGSFGDENRYLFFAQNLLNGFYSPPAPSIDLGNGPGYPILLIPFVAMKLPLVSITALNALFYYFSLIIFYKVLRKFVSLKFTILVSLFFACYFNNYQSIPIIHSELLAIFLITAIIYTVVRVFEENQEKKINYIILSGLLTGYLMLTKPIFSFVILFILVGHLIILIIIKEKSNLRVGIIILLTAFLTVLPYLIYTYSITGKIFYFSTNGGDTFYWMSTPYEKEYGSWYPFHTFEIDSNAIINHDLIPGAEEVIKSNHRKNFEIIFNYQGIERDEVYKSIAVQNIKSNPLKFVKNCICNIGRMIFNYPYSYTAQKPTTLLRLPLNGIIMVLIMFCLVPTIINWRRIFYPIKFLLWFSLLYFCGSILGSAETRMFNLIVPILLLWITYILEKTVMVNLKFNN